MRAMLATLLVVHGLIHLLGFLKAFRLADLPQLTQPITPRFGVLWLVAATLFLAAAVTLYVLPRGWWVVGACAVALSTVVIVPSWADAKFGALANAMIVVAVIVGFFSPGPWSLRAE